MTDTSNEASREKWKASSDALDRLEGRVSRMSRCPGGRASTKASAPVGQTDHVILVPPGGALREGFARSNAYLAAGRSVRLIGHGVTLERDWPSWVGPALGGRFTMTELGAYVLESRATPWSLALRETLRTWLLECFDGVFDDLSPDDVLLASAVTRFMHTEYDPSTYIHGLVVVHPDAAFEMTEERWIGAQLLARAKGESAFELPFAAKTRFAMTVIAGAAVAWPVAASRVVRELVGSAEAFRTLKRRRSEVAREEPEMWAALMPIWPRLSSHLVKHITEGTPPRLGYIMFGGLQSAVREEQNLSLRRAPLFSGLGALTAELDRSIVDHVSGPESIPELLEVLARSMVGTFKAVSRVVKHGPVAPDQGAGPIDLLASSGAVIRLVTISIMLGVSGDVAARSLSERHSFRGKSVVFATATPPEVAAACWRLAAAGAIVTEYHHGFSGGAFSGAGPFKCFWALPEVGDRAPIGERVIVAGTPPQKRAPRKPPGEKLRVLFLSNYAHRNSAMGMPEPVWLPFQDEMLAASEILGRNEREWHFRWRPHPADVDAEVERSMKRFPHLELSRGTDFDDDIAWADVVVSSVSTCIVESILTDVPVFVHLIPEYQDIPLTDFVSPARSFFRADELAKKLESYVRLLRANDPNTLKPEREARVALFGKSGDPASLFEGLAQLAREGATRPTGPGISWPLESERSLAEAGE